MPSVSPSSSVKLISSTARSVRLRIRGPLSASLVAAVTASLCETGLSVARDLTGNTEAAPALPDATKSEILRLVNRASRSVVNGI